MFLLPLRLFCIYQVQIWNGNEFLRECGQNFGPKLYSPLVANTSTRISNIRLESCAYILMDHDGDPAANFNLKSKFHIKF